MKKFVKTKKHPSKIFFERHFFPSFFSLHFIGNSDPKQGKRIFQRLERGRRQRETEVLRPFVLCAEYLAIEIKFVEFLRRLNGKASDKGRLVLFRRVFYDFGESGDRFDQLEFRGCKLGNFVRLGKPAFLKYGIGTGAGVLYVNAGFPLEIKYLIV